MKRLSIFLLVGGIVLLLISLVVYIVRVSYCFPATLPALSPHEMTNFRQDCSLDSSRAVQFSGFLLLFIPGVLLCTASLMLRPPTSQAIRPGPVTSFIVLTLFDSLLLALLALLSYPEAGSGSPKVTLVMAGFGLLAYVSLLGIWRWKRWGLLVFQGTVVLLTIYSGIGGISLFPAVIGIFSAIYLTLVLRPLRKFMV